MLLGRILDTFPINCVAGSWNKLIDGPGTSLELELFNTFTDRHSIPLLPLLLIILYNR